MKPMEMQELFKVMVDKEASDLYLTVARPPMYRIDGKILPVGDHSFTPQELETLVKSVMNESQLRDYGENMEMNMAMSLPGVSRFRVNIFRQRGSAGMVVRRVKAEVSSLAELGLPDILKEITMSKRGLVLVVGATGSGKSTTLAAMVDHRNATESGHIITIEDPIEFVHRHKQSIVTQREVGFDTHSFQAALKNTLRQAPDVILIGEIRDTETMEAAVTFAETGHLCLGTLHSNNANQAIERVLNLFPEESRHQALMDLSLNLKGVVAQRLIKGVTGKLVPAVEVMLQSPYIADLILKGQVDHIKEAMAKSNELGMQTFDQSLFKLYKAGEITLEQAIENADSKTDLSLRVRLTSGNVPDVDGFQVKT